MLEEVQPAIAMKITTVANAIINLPLWAKWGIGGYLIIGVMFNACAGAGSSPSKEAIIKTADQARDRCIVHLKDNPLARLQHENDISKAAYTDGEWRYVGMSSFVGGGVEQRASYRCHIDEQGKLLLFKWHG